MPEISQSVNRYLGEPLHVQVRRMIRELIAEEHPEKLPVEKELMQRFGVSRNTIRRAVQGLGEEGLVRPIAGHGTKVIYGQRNMQRAAVLLLFSRHSMQRPFQSDLFECLLARLNRLGIQGITHMVDEYSAPDFPRLGPVLQSVNAVALFEQIHLPATKELLSILRASGLPVVQMRHMTFPEFPFIVEDARDTFYRLACHLVDLGHRRIAYLGVNVSDYLAGRESTSGWRRLWGLVRALEENGIEPVPELFVDCQGTRYGGYRGMQELLGHNKSFTAVMAMNDITALGALECMHQAGLRIPQDVSITGLDNIRESADFPVSLTTAGADLEDLAEQAVEMMIGPESRDDTTAKSRYLKTRLFLRNSTVRTNVSADRLGDE